MRTLGSVFIVSIFGILAAFTIFTIAKYPLQLIAGCTIVATLTFTLKRI